MSLIFIFHKKKITALLRFSTEIDSFRGYSRILLHPRQFERLQEKLLFYGINWYSIHMGQIEIQYEER